MKLYETLTTQLKKENNYVSDNGELKKWVVANKARNYDAELIALLLENDDLKKTFFKKVNDVMVFLLERFLLFIEQKNYLNDSYTAYRNKIGLTIGGRFLNQRNEVELVWPYKDCILEGGQTKEDQKRPEIFFNQTLAQDEITQLLDPKVLTNYKRYGKFADNAVFHRNAELNEKRGLPKDTITDNLVIKGNNLLALHSLKKEFAGKVKLIYIDPPYNTGSDSFGYNDSFNHSTWLTFMKNRLVVAKELLKEDGVIFVSLDDKEAHYCKLLMDEIFKRENFIADICHKSRGSISNDKIISPNHNHILFYARKEREVFSRREDYGISKDLSTFTEKDDKGYYKLVPVDGPGGAKKGNPYYEFLGLTKYWRFSKETMQTMYDQGLIVKKGNSLSQKYYKSKAEKSRQTITTWWDEGYLTSSASAELSDMLGDGAFSNPKNESLLELIIEFATKESDIVLDYHLGSGTTAAVAHKMNRQYIGIEQMDYIESVTVERLNKVIAGEQGGISKSVGWNPKNPSIEDSANGRYSRNNFVYLGLKKYNQTFIERIESAQDTETLLQIWEQMKEKSFLAYNIDIKTQEANMEQFKQLELAQQKDVLCELLDKNQLYVNVSDMNDERFETTDEERKVTEAFYSKK